MIRLLYNLIAFAFSLPLSQLEKLIEGLKSPDTSLLLPDLLPMTDPFGSTSDAVIGKSLSVSSVMPAVGIGDTLAWGLGVEGRSAPRPLQPLHMVGIQQSRLLAPFCYCK